MALNWYGDASKVIKMAQTKNKEASPRGEAFFYAPEPDFGVTSKRFLL